MIIAGIDEAGYGPLLGPLVVGGCAIELPELSDPFAPLPCIWQRLRKHICKKRPKRSSQIHVNDSKLVYSPGTGLAELERSVLSLLSAHQQATEDLSAVLRCVAEHVIEDLEDHAWYGQPIGFPIANDAMALKLLANAIRIDLQRTNTQCVYWQARVVLERRLNQMIAATHNKATVLFSTAAIHIDALLRQFGERGLVIFCDRQGGRGHYGSLLRTMFDEWSLEIVSEIESRSEYALRRGEHAVRIIFTEKAEAQCLPVALASMLSKYLREVLMECFNAYWKTHLPDVVPTAGYYTDGQRFLRDIHEKRLELGIADEDFVRCR